MKEYVIGLGTVLMMIAFADILIPDGGIKKFASLAMGFMIITAVTAPLGEKNEFFTFDSASFMIDETELEKAEAEYRAAVLLEHKKNLTEKIKAKIKHGSEVFVEVTSEGDLSRVKILLKGDESAAVKYIVETLELPRERIELSYEDN